MTGLVMAAQLILGLSILISLHELGHYLAARAFGIRVEKFYLFFDAWGLKLFKFRKGDTEYGIGWLPLGGYVKISGMVDESLDKEQMNSEPKPWEFRSKPAWQRLIVMIAGVVMNVILGIAIYSFVLFKFTGQYLPNKSVENGIYAYELSREHGLQSGDKVIRIDGKKFERFDDILSTRVIFGARLTVERDGKEVDVIIPDNLYRSIMQSGKNRFVGLDNFPAVVDSTISGMGAAMAGLQKGDRIISVDDTEVNTLGAFREYLWKKDSSTVVVSVMREDTIAAFPVEVAAGGTIGIITNFPYEHRTYNVASAFYYGVSDAFEALVANAKGLGKIFKGQEKASESIQGPIGIATIYGGEWQWQRFWFITGLLSMILAFMNILPIPALDGGHVIFLIIEVITRRKFSDRFMERTQMIGMVILLAIMLFAVYNDIWKHILN